MKADGRRPRRVAEHIREAVSRALTTELGDPRLSSVVVTRVEIGADLSVAHLFVRLLIGDAEPRKRQAVLRALNGSASRLRRRLGPELALKRVPEIRFAYDEAPDKRARVDELLEEIAQESTTSEPLDDAAEEET